MDNIMAQALEIVKAQASTRSMTAEEIASMIKTLTASITGIVDGVEASVKVDDSKYTEDDVKRSIREKSVLCLECGKTFKVLTKRHLETHGLTTQEYLAKWGIKKGTALVAKSLARDRRKKMQDMKLWEKRKVQPKSAPTPECNFPAREEI